MAVYPTGLLAYQRSLARHLPDLAPTHHFAFLRHTDAPGRLTYRPNAHELFVPGDPESPLAPMLLKKRLQVRGGQLLHATGGLFPPGIEVPVVTTVHDLVWLTHASWLRRPGLRGRVTSAMCRRYVGEALRHSARIIVPSEATRREIDEVAPFASDRVCVIHHGVGAIFQPLDQDDGGAVDRVRAACRRLLPGASRFVLDVGRAAAYRNHTGLIRAFTAAFKSDYDVHLAFVQAMGAQTRDMMRLASRLGMDGRVHVLSGVSSRDLIALYQGAICLCHPTLHEAYATVVAEAMACGCPVITSGRAAAGEVAEGVAQLVNPEHEDEIAAAMRRVAYESGVSARMRAKGLARAKLLEAQRMAEATWRVYRAALGTTSGCTARAG
ncbi:MAG: glycosyltransferase family 4 protein [Polyangiaceae bacterium]|nr:glycosyltransferase family 4 protein [Polyangiaceae bacterium]